MQYLGKNTVVNIRKVKITHGYWILLMEPKVLSQVFKNFDSTCTIKNNLRIWFLKCHEGVLITFV